VNNSKWPPKEHPRVVTVVVPGGGMSSELEAARCRSQRLHDRLEVTPEGVPEGCCRQSARRQHVDIAGGSTMT
jgi:hypothetical protein